MKTLCRQTLLWLLCGICFCSAAQSDTSIHLQGATLSTANPDLLMIADIAITGNKKTKSYIIEREIPFSQGDYILRGDLEKKLILARQQIMNTSLFIDVTVSIASETGELVFISIHVKERWYLFPLPYFKIIDQNFNQWWVEHKRDLNRVNYGIKFQQYNVSGRNDELNIWLISGYNRQISFRYEQPYVDKALKSGFSIGFNYSTQRELNYETLKSKQIYFKQDDFVKQTIKVEGAYLYRPAIKTKHIFKLAYVDEKIADTIYKLNPAYFPNHATRVRFPELTYKMEYFDVDYIPYPSKGFMGDFSISKKGLNKNMDLWELNFQGNYTIPVSRLSQLQFQAAGILRLPFNQPFYNQQLLGYNNYFMRGLEYYVIDGVAGAVGRATARNEVFSFAFKNPVKSQTHNLIPFRFFLKAYGDLGYAYNKNAGSSLLNNRLLKTWGVGLDIVTIYDVVFKIDYSFNQLGNSGFFIHTRTDF